MYEFIRIQYILGNLTPEQVRGYAPKWITAEQAEQIVGGTDDAETSDAE
jgi:hypothetical protein